MFNYKLVAHELKKAAEVLEKIDKKTYSLSGNGKSDCKLILNFHKDKWKDIGNKPEWLETVEWLNDECKGNFHGIDHSCSKIGVDGVEHIELTFNDVNDADHKSHKQEMVNNLKSLGFNQE